jgi:hypothetical protein
MRNGGWLSTLQGLPNGSFVCGATDQRARTAVAAAGTVRRAYHAHVRVLAQARLAQDGKIIRQALVVRHCLGWRFEGLRLRRTRIAGKFP